MMSDTPRWLLDGMAHTAWEDYQRMLRDPRIGLPELIKALAKSKAADAALRAADATTPQLARTR